jgi:hypothetical protein
MSTRTLREKIQDTIQYLDSRQLQTLWRFVRQLSNSSEKRQNYSSGAEDFWKLKGTGQSGCTDVGRQKHKYLSEAYRRHG